MISERPRQRALEWTILMAVLVQTALAFYSYGRLVERVEDLVRRVDRVERLLDPAKK